MLKYALVLERETLEPVQKLPYKRSGLFGVIQGGNLGYEPSEVILSFFEPMDKISRVYFVRFVEMNSEENLGNTIQSTKSNLQLTQSAVNSDLGGMNPENKVLNVEHTCEPIAL